MNKSLTESNNGMGTRMGERESVAAKAFGEAIRAALPGRHAHKEILRMMARHKAAPHPNTVRLWLRGEKLPSHEYMLIFIAEFGRPLLDLVYADALAGQGGGVEKSIRDIEVSLRVLKAQMRMADENISAHPRQAALRFG